MGLTESPPEAHSNGIARRLCRLKVLRFRDFGFKSRRTLFRGLFDVGRRSPSNRRAHCQQFLQCPLASCAKSVRLPLNADVISDASPQSLRPNHGERDCVHASGSIGCEPFATLDTSSHNGIPRPLNSGVLSDLDIYMYAYMAYSPVRFASLNHI